MKYKNYQKIRIIAESFASSNANTKMGRAGRLPDTLWTRSYPGKTILNPLYHYASDNNGSLFSPFLDPCEMGFPLASPSLARAVSRGGAEMQQASKGLNYRDS